MMESNLKTKNGCPAHMDKKYQKFKNNDKKRKNSKKYQNKRSSKNVKRILKV